MNRETKGYKLSAVYNKSTLKAQKMDLQLFFKLRDPTTISPTSIISIFVTPMCTEEPEGVKTGL
jgi:hypothetical protein